MPPATGDSNAFARMMVMRSVRTIRMIDLLSAFVIEVAGNPAEDEIALWVVATGNPRPLSSRVERALFRTWMTRHRAFRVGAAPPT